MGPFWVVVTLPLWWTAVAWLVGVSWRQIASQYPATGEPEGERIAWQSGKIGSVRYNGALVMHRSAKGLRIQPMGPFKLFHPPIFLPWSALHHPREQSRDFVELDLDRGATIRVRKRVLGDAPIR